MKYLSILLSLLFLSHHLSAQTRTVTSTADAGAGSLRETISLANSGDSIVIDASLAGDTIFLASEILLDKNLTISGLGTTCPGSITLDAQSNGRIFRVDTFATVVIDHLTFSQGIAGDGGAIYNEGNLTITCAYFTLNKAIYGGAIYSIASPGNPCSLTLTDCDFHINGFLGICEEGGAIFNNGLQENCTVLATDCRFRNCVAQQINASTSGGAILNKGASAGATFRSCIFDANGVLAFSLPFSSPEKGIGGAIANMGGTLHLLDCSTITHNQAQGGLTYGGAIYNDTASTCSLTRCKLSNNDTGDLGGAIANFGTLTIFESEFINNVAIGTDGVGGGVYESGLGSISIRNSTFERNNALSDGGSLYLNYASTQSAAPEILNNTFSANATGKRGGALFVTGQNQLALIHCTFVQNTATDSGGAIYITPLPVVSLQNNLIADNVSNGGPDLMGLNNATITSLGGNLIGNGSDSNIPLLPSDLSGTFINPIDPQVAALGYYGGPTATHFLESTSPAIDAAVGMPISTDQRGTRRTAISDIGAFELHRVMLRPADSLHLCIGSPFAKMDSIVIVDSTGGAIHPGPSQALLLDLPVGFRLLQGQGEVTLHGNGLSNPSIFVSDSVVIVFFDRSTEIGFQKIVISDLLVRATQAGTGNLVRRVSNAAIIGDSPMDSLSHAFLSASALAPLRPPDAVFTVCADTGEVPVAIPLTSPLLNGNAMVWYASPNDIGLSSLDTTIVFSNYQFTDTCYFALHNPCNLFFYVTQIDNNGCESRPATIEIDANPVPDAPNPLFSADLSYCEGTASPSLQLVPNTGATYFWYDAGGTLLDSTVLSSYDLELDSLQFDQDSSFVFTVRQKVNGCLSRDAQPFTLLGRAKLPISFEAKHLCLGESTDFHAVAPPAATSFTWNFSSGLNSGVIHTSGPDTSIVIQNTGFIVIELTVEDSFGCKSSYEDFILVKDLGAAFTWSRICEQDITLLVARSYPFSDSITLATSQGFETFKDELTYLWDYGDPTDPTPGMNRGTAHRYPQANRYLPKLTVTSSYINLHGNLSIGCVDSAIEQVTILPVIDPIAVAGDTFYYDGFEDQNRVNREWLTGGKLNNWEVAKPSDSLLNRAASGEYAWVTDADEDYPNKMNAWVASPCYDLRQMKRPMLSMDLAVATEATFDGGSIQYTSDGGVNWHLLGTVGSGLNWYTDQNLQSNPGLQDNVRHNGWSGNLPWHTVRQRLDLDSLLAGTDSLLRFRINMGADSSVTGEGIAFDNFAILDRTSKVLIEQFVNQDVPPEVYALIDSNEKDIQYLQYHISYPDESDAIFVENQRGPDADARAYYYGISGPANIVLDGDARLTPAYETLQQELDLKILQDPQFDISIRDNGVAFSALQDVQRRIVLHVAVAEDRLPQGGGTPYRYVVRKLFPDAGGTVVEDGLIKGEAKFVDVAWRNADRPSPSIIPSNRRDSLYLIAFVQDDVSKRIFDVAIRKASPQIFESRLGQGPDSTLRYALFPNPTADWLEVHFAEPLPATETCALYDLQGRRVLTRQLAEGDTRIRLDMRALAQGVYVLELRLSGEVRREKVIRVE